MNKATSLFAQSGKLSIPGAAELGFDPQQMKAKYEFERDRRLRSRGETQYQEVEGEFAHYNDDPFTPRIEREPVRETVEVVVLGGGFGGLYMGARLARQLLSSALIETDRLGLSALTLWTAKPEVYAGHGFELEDTGWFGWVTGWPATSGAGRKAISQMHHWPDNAELAGLRRGLPAYVSYGQRLRDDDGRAEVVLLFDGQGPALAEWRGDDNAVLNLLAATMPPRWRLNALADDTLPAALARARAAVNLTPGRLQMWRATDSVRGRARPALRLLDRI